MHTYIYIYIQKWDALTGCSCVCVCDFGIGHRAEKDVMQEPKQLEYDFGVHYTTSPRKDFSGAMLAVAQTFYIEPCQR